MPTFTPRLQLIKRSDLENVSVEDLNANFDEIDAATGFTVVTSTTRPLVPFDGQLIRETDTKAWGYWSAEAGVWYMFDTEWQTTPLVMSFGDATHPVLWNSAGQLQKYVRAGKRVDVSVYVTGHVSMSINGGTGFAYVKYPVGSVPNDIEAGGGFLGKGFLAASGGSPAPVNIRKTLSIPTRDYYVLANDANVAYGQAIWGSTMQMNYRYTYDMV